MNLSVVIIACKEDAAGTERSLQSLAGLGADILLYDISDGDVTLQQATRYHARYFKGIKESFELVRYKAAQLALHDWVLMLHTGEEPDEELRRSLMDFDTGRHGEVFRIRFKNMFEKKWIRYGGWGDYNPVRLANRKDVQVFDGRVNEQLFVKQPVVITWLKGNILHSTVHDKKELATKTMRKALLAAARYYREGRKFFAHRLFLSPIAAFFRNYFLKMGFLDGKPGYDSARMEAWYTFLKYARLMQLRRLSKRPV